MRRLLIVGGVFISLAAPYANATPCFEADECREIALPLSDWGPDIYLDLLDGWWSGSPERGCQPDRVPVDGDDGLPAPTVPEPSTIVLLGGALVVLLGYTAWGRRRDRL